MTIGLLLLKLCMLIDDKVTYPIIIGQCTNTEFWDRVLRSEFDHRAYAVINPTKERGPKTMYEFNNRIIIGPIIYLYKIINLIE